ncbi:alpha/beta hydrolase [Nonomuraea sp. MTCD27]|uniref:alpha/beta hydrolase n=1 Tax=Nonomuraea sp. MTCD27 TaxID=1676747 RepID=UPI0035C0284F
MWAIPEGTDPDRALLYFYFGGSVVASMHSDRKAAGHIAKAAGIRSLVVDFRLAPEHPYPAQLDDAEAAYRWLLSQGYEPRHIGSTGHSIGGTLAIMLPLRLLALGEATPGAIVSISPWTDLTIGNATTETNAGTDKILTKSTLELFRAAWLQDPAVDFTDPKISLLHADLTGLPPTSVHYGEHELLAGEGAEFARRLADFTVPSEVRPMPEGQHSFILGAGRVPEVDQGRSSREVGGCAATSAPEHQKPLVTAGATGYRVAGKAAKEYALYRVTTPPWPCGADAHGWPWRQRNTRIDLPWRNREHHVQGRAHADGRCRRNEFRLPVARHGKRRPRDIPQPLDRGLENWDPRTAPPDIGCSLSTTEALARHKARHRTRWPRWHMTPSPSSGDGLRAGRSPGLLARRHARSSDRGRRAEACSQAHPRRHRPSGWLRPWHRQGDLAHHSRHDKGALTFKDPKQYLFFTRTANGRTAARQFLEWLKERMDNRDKAISLTALRAQLKAIHAWGCKTPLTCPTFSSLFWWSTAKRTGWCLAAILSTWATGSGLLAGDLNDIRLEMATTISAPCR